MCRFVAYLGTPLAINEVISKPKDSLVKQSLYALESDVRVNADGFGIGWYNFAVTTIPAVFVSVLPAWSDINLTRISHQIISSCFFGHVRAAEIGAVTLYNCHPFHYQRYLFMHNGIIAGFKQIKLALCNLIREDIFLEIKGNTDSETLFALWLTYFASLNDGNLPNLTHTNTTKTCNDMLTAWRKTIMTITALQEEHHITKTTYINAMITDGNNMIGVRYSSDVEDHLSLYYTVGEKFFHNYDGCHMLQSNEIQNRKAVLIASERITVHKEEWSEVPKQHAIVVDSQKQIQLIPL